MSQVLNFLHSESWSLIALAALLVVAMLAHQALFFAAGRTLDASLVRHCRAPTALIVPLRAQCTRRHTTRLSA